MNDRRTHYVTTTDGITIGATVRGEGPPLVLLQGAVGDGDLDWNRVVEHLTDRFTCHLPSYRGRGLSGDHPDGGPGRRAEDFLTYIDSIGGPTGLVGWSGGANTALAVAARSDAVEAVALVEPGMLSLMESGQQAEVGAIVARTAQLAAAGDPAAAVRAFLRFPFDEAEIAVAEEAGYVEASGRYVTNLLDLLRHEMEHDNPTAEDPAVLGAISAPVLLLRGAHTKPFFVASTRHVADHVPDARVHQIAGAGHATPLTHPEALAEALVGFFAPARQPA